ncbi:MAG: hypothetical protein Q4D56_06695 [Bacteroides sp.]|nr:hypothetical protein [Bacteroides sp.]
MSYIKFVLNKRLVDGEKPYNAVISRIESDMADTSLLETNIIMHALAAIGGKVVDVTEFILDSSQLDTDILG